MISSLIHDQSEPRCMGRSVRVMGQATLERDCTDCERRTDILSGQTYRWIKPPTDPVCPMRVGKVQTWTWV